MKKIVFFTVALVFSIIALCANFVSASAWIGDWYENEDIAFTSIMQEMKDDKGYDWDTYTYVKAPLNTTEGYMNGYVFDFILDGQRNGYVLMVAVNEGYEVTEIYVDIQSLFFGNTGVNIYPTFLKYISYNNGLYYDLLTNDEIDIAVVKEMEIQGFGFNGGGSGIPWEEIVYYSSKTVETNQISRQFPGYTAGADGVNNCAPTAGMHLVAYWDVYKENLIPNFTVYTMLGSVLIWKPVSPNAVAAANSLYTLMGTNTTGEGTTINQFKTGLTSYASINGGYTVAYTSTMTNSNYDLTKMLSSFAANKPVVLFMSPQFNYICAITAYNGFDYIAGNEYPASSHTMIAYGRQINRYYNSSGTLTREITFLKIASCLQGAGVGWLRLNEGYLHIDDSYSVEII